jgi:hypothetical protein
MTFEDIVKKTQSALKKELVSELNKIGYKTITKKGFIYAEGDIPVMLVAHLDTVHSKTVRAICYSSDGNTVMSPEGIGGDDRAGVYMILQIIKDHRCHVLFCEDEETGGIGASLFIKSKIAPEVNYIVELDRRGYNDAVFYDCDNPDFIKFVTGFSFAEDYGSFSDISIIAPKLGIAAVNISTGYFNEHTRYEYVDMEAVRQNISRVGKMVSTASARFEYMEATRFNRMSFFDLMAIRQLKKEARQFGLLETDVDLLLDYGYDLGEIEIMLNYPQELRRAINELSLDTMEV